VGTNLVGYFEAMSEFNVIKGGVFEEVQFQLMEVRQWKILVVFIKVGEQGQHKASFISDKFTDFHPAVIFFFQLVDRSALSPDCPCPKAHVVLPAKVHPTRDGQFRSRGPFTFSVLGMKAWKEKEALWKSGRTQISGLYPPQNIHIRSESTLRVQNNMCYELLIPFEGKETQAMGIFGLQVGEKSSNNEDMSREDICAQAGSVAHAILRSEKFNDIRGRLALIIAVLLEPLEAVKSGLAELLWKFGLHGFKSAAPPTGGSTHIQMICPLSVFWKWKQPQFSTKVLILQGSGSRR